MGISYNVSLPTNDSVNLSYEVATSSWTFDDNDGIRKTKTMYSLDIFADIQDEAILYNTFAKISCTYDLTVHPYDDPSYTQSNIDGNGNAITLKNVMYDEILPTLPYKPLPNTYQYSMPLSAMFNRYICEMLRNYYVHPYVDDEGYTVRDSDYLFNYQIENLSTYAYDGDIFKNCKAAVKKFIILNNSYNESNNIGGGYVYFYAPSNKKLIVYYGEQSDDNDTPSIFAESLGCSYNKTTGLVDTAQWIKIEFNCTLDKLMLSVFEIPEKPLICITNNNYNTDSYSSYDSQLILKTSTSCINTYYQDNNPLKNYASNKKGFKIHGNTNIDLSAYDAALKYDSVLSQVKHESEYEYSYNKYNGDKSAAPSFEYIPDDAYYGTIIDPYQSVEASHYNCICIPATKPRDLAKEIKRRCINISINVKNSDNSDRITLLGFIGLVKPALMLHHQNSLTFNIHSLLNDFYDADRTNLLKNKEKMEQYGIVFIPTSAEGDKYNKDDNGNKLDFNYDCEFEGGWTTFIPLFVDNTPLMKLVSISDPYLDTAAYNLSTYLSENISAANKEIGFPDDYNTLDNEAIYQAATTANEINSCIDHLDDAEIVVVSMSTFGQRDEQYQYNKLTSNNVGIKINPAQLWTKTMKSSSDIIYISTAGYGGGFGQYVKRYYPKAWLSDISLDMANAPDAYADSIQKTIIYFLSDCYISNVYHNKDSAKFLVHRLIDAASKNNATYIDTVNNFNKISQNIRQKIVAKIRKFFADILPKFLEKTAIQKNNKAKRYYILNYNRIQELWLGNSISESNASELYLVPQLLEDLSKFPYGARFLLNEDTSMTSLEKYLFSFTSVPVLAQMYLDKYPNNITNNIRSFLRKSNKFKQLFIDIYQEKNYNKSMYEYIMQEMQAMRAKANQAQSGALHPENDIQEKIYSIYEFFYKDIAEQFFYLNFNDLIDISNELQIAEQDNENADDINAYVSSQIGYNRIDVDAYVRSLRDIFHLTIDAIENIWELKDYVSSQLNDFSISNSELWDIIFNNMTVDLPYAGIVQGRIEFAEKKFLT